VNSAELVRQLTDPKLLQQQFMRYIRELTSYKKAQSEAIFVNESPKYAKYLEDLSNMLNKLSEDAEHKQIFDFILQLNLVYIRMMAENNQRLLRHIFSSHHNQE
jgi:hypothetical protein